VDTDCSPVIARDERDRQIEREHDVGERAKRQCWCGSTSGTSPAQRWHHTGHLNSPGLPTMLGQQGEEGGGRTCVADRAHVKRHEKGLGEKGVQGADCAGAPDVLAHDAVWREHKWRRGLVALVSAQRFLEQLLDALDLADLLRFFLCPRLCHLLLLFLVARLRPPRLGGAYAPGELQRPRNHRARREGGRSRAKLKRLRNHFVRRSYVGAGVTCSWEKKPCN
jgi:hypothetical protein